MLNRGTCCYRIICRQALTVSEGNTRAFSVLPKDTFPQPLPSAPALQAPPGSIRHFANVYPKGTTPRFAGAGPGCKLLRLCTPPDIPCLIILSFLQVSGKRPFPRAPGKGRRAGPPLGIIIAFRIEVHSRADKRPGDNTSIIKTSLDRPIMIGLRCNRPFGHMHCN